MKDVGELLGGIAALAWPGVVLCLAWMFRAKLLKLADAFGRQIDRGAFFKWKDVELRGVPVADLPTLDNSVYELKRAKKEDVAYRQGIYQNSRSLMLVHTAKRTDELDEDGLTYFDLSIYIIPHQRFDEKSNLSVLKLGRINEIDKVEYYLGASWINSEYGEWFTTSNGSDNFALLFNKVIGPALCLARVTFHDKTTVELSRYLDLEGAGGISGKTRFL